jgi:thioredoxin reductase
MHGFLSRDGAPPASLLQEGRAELARYGVEVITGRVDRIDAGFSVRLADGAVLAARRVLVATGLRDQLPGIPGLRERWASDVLHCPYCHGYEVKDRPIGVLGTHPAAVHHALLLRQWSDDVVFMPHTLDLADDDRERITARGIEIVDGEIAQLVVADDQLRGVEMADGQVVPRSVVFVFPHMVPLDELLTGLGCDTDERGWVTIDATGRTSVPGVWAVGNVVDPRAQVVTAAGQGSVAAIAINHDLLEEDIRRDVECHRSAEPLAGVPAYR